MLITTGLYLDAVASTSRVDTARAQLMTAQAVYDRAMDLKTSGMVPGIDVLRAQVQLQTQQQRLVAAENDRAKQKLNIARAIGMPQTQDFALTNNFVFDTFATNGALIVEAEDYNYNSGQFQDNPPVSGLDPNGSQMNAGLGYYGMTGTRNIDYYDTDAGAGGNNHQYRYTDGVGSFQNIYAGDMPRPDHVFVNVADYALWRMQAGEWLNYTRTFPTNNWNVYLRTSSQTREDVRFDEVTGDTTMPSQAKVLRGDFLVPNTGSSTRFPIIWRR